MSEEDGRAMMAEYFEYTEGLRRSGAYVSGEPLESAQTATTVRQRDGQQVISDGPFAETREVLGGFYVLGVRLARPGAGACRALPGRPLRLGRGAARDGDARHGVTSRGGGSRPGVPVRVRPRRRAACPRPRRHRTAEDAVQDAYPARCAGGRPTASPTTRGLDRHGRPQQGDRPPAPRPGADERRAELTRAQPRTRRTGTTRAPTTIPDERLRLIFTCCHPALRPRPRWR